jgi:hypothetical protein
LRGACGGRNSFEKLLTGQIGKEANVVKITIDRSCTHSNQNLAENNIHHHSNVKRSLQEKKPQKGLFQTVVQYHPNRQQSKKDQRN